MLPTQWIETDQNDHLKRPGVVHVPDLKSRLVACGQFENCPGLRTDSPTVDVEGLNLVSSFAACLTLFVALLESIFCLRGYGKCHKGEGAGGYGSNIVVYIDVIDFL